MGIRPRCSNDRLRTIWTPEMDRYFIDLMLEQVNKGSRIDDNLFSKRAWKHMMLSFNGRFKFQYDKDVLKNRHKSLRNLCKGITNLLDQKGFTWDDTKKMVIADNQVWDKYIKEHPDARSYRIKTVPYYKDLYQIYGKSSCKQKEPGNNGSESSRHPHSSDNGALTMPTNNVDEEDADSLPYIVVDEDFRISVPEGDSDSSSRMEPNAIGSSIGCRPRTYWQPPMDRFFIDLMLDQVQKGNQVDGIFLKQAWIEMIESFNAEFGFNYEVDVLKNRYKTLRRQFNTIKNLLNLEGFSWDNDRQMVTADDYIWQDYIKAHKDVRQYMTRPVPYYKDLYLICHDLSVEDRELLLCQNRQQPNEVQLVKNQQASQMSESLAASVSSKHQDTNLQELGTLSSTVLISRKRQSEEHLNISTRKKQLWESDQGTEDVQLKLETAASTLSGERRNDEDSCSFQIEDVIKAVQDLPEMDEDLILDACDFLEDEKKVKTFMALHVKLRRKWLVRKLRPQLH